MLHGLILIDALSSAYWENKKRKKKNSWGAFFPMAGHALLLVLHGIFTLLGVIKG
jgi:hypothetical protein